MVVNEISHIAVGSEYESIESGISKNKQIEYYISLYTTILIYNALFLRWEEI